MYVMDVGVVQYMISNTIEEFYRKVITDSNVIKMNIATFPVSDPDYSYIYNKEVKNKQLLFITAQDFSNISVCVSENVVVDLNQDIINYIEFDEVESTILFELKNNSAIFISIKELQNKDEKKTRKHKRVSRSADKQS